MKNKAMTYLLGLVVLIVWGLIIYRVFAAAGGSDENTMPGINPNLKKESYNDYTVPKDTSRLLLNYRDPFALAKSKDTAEIPVKKLVHQSLRPAVVQPAFNWNFIKYSGYIRNPGSKKLITMVVINGKNETLAQGETKDQVRLIRNLGDSIKISYNGKTKFIPIKPPSL